MLPPGTASYQDATAYLSMGNFLLPHVHTTTTAHEIEGVTTRRTHQAEEASLDFIIDCPSTSPLHPISGLPPAYTVELAYTIAWSPCGLLQLVSCSAAPRWDSARNLE